MKAAVVESFDHPPRYMDFEAPIPEEDEVIVSPRAAALSQLVRAQAAGNHYSSGKPPMVPGADGMGVLENGSRVYFAFPRGPVGAMAERVAVKETNIVELPDDIDDVTAAAIANPGMSSWASLVERADFKRGETVLVNGANGASGRLAIQIAKHLGAGRVVATGRNPACASELRALGADEFVLLEQDPTAMALKFREEIACGVNVILDYLWGPSAEAFLSAAIGHGSVEAAPRIRFVNIGSMGGPTISVNAGALRSSGLELFGSGLGSLSHAALIRSIKSLMQVVNSAGLKIDTQARALKDVESVWREKSSARLVFTL